MLKWLLKSLLILAVFVPFATALPVAALWLCRTPDGAQFLFWTGPWSCCFWVLIYSQLSAAPWRQGRGRRVSVARGERRAAAHEHPSHGLDVRCFDLFLRCGVHDALPFSSLAVRQNAAPGLHLFAFVFRMVLEEAAWMISRAAR